MPRVIRSRSSAQNWSEVIVAFQMPYSCAIGQYSAVSMVVVIKIFWKILRCCGIKNMLVKLASDIYMIWKASVWMMYTDWKQGNLFGNISGVLKICLISEMVAHGSWCCPHQRVGSLISYCCAFVCSLHSNLLYYVWCQA